MYGSKGYNGEWLVIALVWRNGRSWPASFRFIRKRSKGSFSNVDLDDSLPLKRYCRGYCQSD